MDAQQLGQLIGTFTGGETVYRHSLMASFNYTEGVRAFFQSAGGGAYWLADILATEPKVRAGVVQDGFCVARLKVESDCSAVLTVARDVSGDDFDGVHYSQEIKFTDCPEGTWTLYLTYTTVGSSDVVLAMLPREY